MQNDLKFSGDMPVVINYQGSADDIYAPVRSSSCDIEMVAKHILDDLYTARKDEICVRVKKGNTTIWEGYKQPNTYSQPVTQNLDAISVTCIDPVSILKFITIDKLFDKPRIMTYGQIIGKALSFVMIDVNTIKVERSVTYSGNNDILDLQIQTANFWDEADEPATAYDVIGEMLRPFCLTLVHAGDSYQIYSVNKVTGTRTFDVYIIGDDGSLSASTTSTETKADETYDEEDWKSNNTQEPTIQIDNTYEKVTGTCSTQIPEYSDMAVDLVDYTQRDLYDANWFNVQRNKAKGYVAKGTSAELDTNDNWFYIWNGIYINDDYGLNSHGGYDDWYININKAYNYVTGNAGHPSDYGSILNFYGGANNPTGTGKTQVQERSVNIKKRITAYAPDNGTPPEFLENADLSWKCPTGHYIRKEDISDAKFGEFRNPSTSRRIVYSQKYENVNLSSNDEMILKFDMSCSFSRTGVDVKFDPINSNTATNKTYSGGQLTSCDSKCFPITWNASKVVVNSVYFRKYSVGGNIHVTPIWDMRRISMYIVMSDNSVKQFNGKEWVNDLHPEVANSFYLKKLMNGEQLFNSDHRCDIIECSDGEEFTLGDEPYTYRMNNHDEIVESGGTEHTIPVYMDWVAGAVTDCSAGSLSVILPYVNDPGAVIYVDVYNSTMLNMTGGKERTDGSGPTPFFYLGQNGTTVYSVDDMWVNNLPPNVSHVKAEHLDLSITVTVPKSNLGQMFPESDIEYNIDNGKDYVEKYEGPSFRVNTYNQLVISSWSYLLYNNQTADPNLFTVNGVSARPECYVVQAYMNWLGTIRKTYTKTLLPESRTRGFSNIRTFIESPEIGTNELMVVSDSWDVKTGRHSVVAVEDQDFQVSTVDTVNAVEVPRRARADRWNLPTANKN